MLRRHRHRPRALLVVLALGLVAAGCSSDDDGDATSDTSAGPTTTGSDSTGTTPPDSTPQNTTAPVDVTPTEIIGVEAGSSLDQPIAMVTRPGDDALWLAERPGTVRRLENAEDGTWQPIGDPVLDITDMTSTESERGLLGMAFDETGDTLFLSHTDAQGNSDVAAYDVVDNTVDAGSRRVIFEVDQPFQNHNGGHIVLGPDGRLWLGLGDGGGADDPHNNAQDDSTPLGKMVAIDLGTGEAEQVAKGLRNPWRFAFDTDGSLWIADVGQNVTEEIDHVAADEIAGANFGWSGYEGSTPYLDGDGRRPADAIPPVYEYGRDGGACSITGGVPYHGTLLPHLEGAYIFADYCTGQIQALRLDPDGGEPTVTDLGVNVINPISFATDVAGEVYVLSIADYIVRLAPA